MTGYNRCEIAERELAQAIIERLSQGRTVNEVTKMLGLEASKRYHISNAKTMSRRKDREAKYGGDHFWTPVDVIHTILRYALWQEKLSELNATEQAALQPASYSCETGA
jgi:hypothetical protein